MTQHNADNERIKHAYLRFLRDARSQSESTIDAAAKALDRFEIYTKHINFKRFHHKQASAFKRHLLQQKGLRSGDVLSKATLYSTLTHLKRFFQWLAREPGYKSRVRYSDADYFNLSANDTRIAKARREQRAPTLEQVKHVISVMPGETEIDLRNRAILALTILTGARDGAIASLKLKHIDLVNDCVVQDAREVKTKRRKTFTTWFFPVGDEVRLILVEWVTYLRESKWWGDDDPLFPATRVGLGPTQQFELFGVQKIHWKNATPIRRIFREAFVNAGLEYFNPHSFRHTLVRLGEKFCKTPEQFKAWSQNLGHEKPLTTFLNYGEVPYERQAQIFKELAAPYQPERSQADEIADAVIKKLRLEIPKEVNP